MRFVILGSSGTGKTTLNRHLSEKFNIPSLPLDSVYWKKDWDHISKEQYHIYMKEFLKKNKSWVIDGNYTNNRHFEYRLALADYVIILDFGTQASLQGIFQRAGEYKHQVRSDMAEGCIEGIDQIFLKYVKDFHKVKGKYLKAIAKKYANKQVLIFKNRKELYDWYNSL